VSASLSISTSRRSFPIIGAALALVVFAQIPAQAAGIARDAETEALIRDYAKPIFKAAGIRGQGVNIYVVTDDTFNAFVASAGQMFINTGAIIEAKTPNELIGVIAHETGHLAHGDLAAIRQQIASTRNAALAAALVGFGVAIAGGAAGVSGLGDLGTAIVAGTSQVAQRSLLAYQRAQEAAADRSAVDFLDKTGQSGTGLIAILKRLANDSLLSSRDIDPYLQNHPMPGDRIAALEGLVAKGKFIGRVDSPDLQRRHDLVRAKLVGFTWAPERVARRYPMSDQSLPARYARAIAVYRSGALAPALKQIDALIAADPSNPYFLELKGQALLEGGKAAGSIAPLREAVALAPNASLIKALYGQALVATGSKADVDEAVKTLTVALQSDPEIPFGFRALARAYALQDNIPMAELATAQGLFASGDFGEAKLHAVRAQAKLKTGTPAWLRADDIVSYKPPRASAKPVN
jgi:predicted Zn-dependent protease